jgi:YegS/Rv2252/BmrU family lipid kinase
MGSGPIVLIINPNAGNGSTGAKWPLIQTLVRDRLGPFEHFMTEGPGDAEHLAAEAVHGGPERVICVGGDGTLNEVINGLMAEGEAARSRPVLGFIPNGTGCDFVRTVAIPRNIERAINVIAANHFSPMDIGRLIFYDHAGNRACRYFHNITSFGLGGEVDERVNRTTKAFGPFLSFIWATLISIFLYGKKRINLKIDDSPETEFVIWNVAVANGQYHGGGMWVAPDAAVDDGLFHLTVIGDLSIPAVFYNLPKLYSGKIKAVPTVSTFIGKKITATSDETVLLDVDGEQPGMLPVEIDVIPGALNIISEA